MRRPAARLQNSRTDWYRIQNGDKLARHAEIFIYDEIGYFGDSAKGFAKALNELDSDELTVHINSPGGDIFDGLAIYQAIKDHPARVTVKVDGLAASIASVIAMAGDELVMAPKATMMIHDGWAMSVGNAGEFRKMADLLDKQSEIIASVYGDRSGQPADFWRDRMRDETWYNAQEALDAGLIDQIEGQEKPKKEEAFDLGVFAHAGRDKAPEPVIKPEARKELKGEPGPELVDLPEGSIVVAKADLKKEGETAVPTVVSKEPEPFTWDFAAFQASLKEGLKRG
jgi:ATP-dependent protease ClpP protease subunit